MKNNKTIAITGTPGTGKTTLAEKVTKNLNFELIDLNKFISKRNIYETDEKGTKIVDPKELQDTFQDILENQDQDLIVDGLLSYLLSSDQIDYIVVLRTNPNILRERLNKRDDFSKEKIKENVESEALGTVTSESIERHGVENIFEIDTTERDPKEILNTLKKGLEDEIQLRPGEIDWLEEYLKNSPK